HVKPVIRKGSRSGHCSMSARRVSAPPEFRVMKCNPRGQASIYCSLNASKAATIESTPVRMGSTQGKPKDREVLFNTARASGSFIAEVLRDTPTNRTSELVKRAAAR